MRRSILGFRCCFVPLRPVAPRLMFGGAAGTRIFDQHWVPQVPTDRRIQPGDQISLGISHPCMTFDKWRWITLLDGEIVVDVVRTFF
jgi:D-serine dehydratase